MTRGHVRAAGRCALATALAVALSASLAPPAGALGPYRVQRPEVKKLENGLEVMVISDPRASIVGVALRIPAGVATEPREQNGLANVTARMLGRGTTSRTAGVFAGDLAQLGAGFSADAGRDHATMTSTFLARDFEAGIELFADAVTHPVLLEEEFRRAANLVGRGVIQIHQNPPATAAEQLWTLALPDVPVARPPLGRLETLGKLTLDQVRAFHRERYRPGGSVLAIAGDITPERAFKLAEEWFGGWAGGEAAPLAPAVRPEKSARARIRVVDIPGATNVAIAVGFAVPGRGAADALARSVAASVFEQQFAERVARGGVRDVGSSLELTRDVGLWVVQAAAPADSAAVLARRLTSELKRFLFAPPPLQDVSAAQHRIRRGMPLAFETVDGVMGQWLLAKFAGFPADYFDGYGARVAALTPQELQSAARRDADVERPFIVAVGAAKKISPLLQPLGPAEVMVLDKLPEAQRSPADTLAARTPEQEAAGRKLITQALAAHGGRSKLTVIKSTLVDAAVRFQIPGSEVTGTLRQLRKEPKKLALLTSIRGVDTRQVLNGSRSWTVIAESDTAQEGDSLDVEAMRIAYTSDLPHVLLAASGKSAQVAARGRDRVSGRDADKVEVVAPGDPWRMLYLDPTNHRLIAFEQRERGPRGHFIARRVLGDYRPLEGVQWPYQEERFIGSQPLMKLDVTGVQLNIDLSEKQFEPPKMMVPWR